MTRGRSSYDHLFMKSTVQILDRIDQPLSPGKRWVAARVGIPGDGSDMDGPYRTDIRQLSASKTVRCKPRLTGLDSGKQADFMLVFCKSQLGMNLRIGLGGQVYVSRVGSL